MMLSMLMMVVMMMMVMMLTKILMVSMMVLPESDDARGAVDDEALFFCKVSIFSKGGVGSRLLKPGGITWLCCALGLSLGLPLSSYRASSTR